MSKESTIKAIDVTLEGMRWAKMRGEHSDADMFRQIYAELVDLANEVYGTLWYAELVDLANEVYGTLWVGKLKDARGLER